MPRTTLASNQTWWGTSQVSTWYPYHSPPEVTSETVVSSTRVETRDTKNTPGFRSSRPGTPGSDMLPFNSFKYELKVTNNTSGTVLDDWPAANYKRRRSGVLLNEPADHESFVIDSQFLDWIRSRCINGSLRGVKDSHVNLGVTLASRKQTYAMVSQAFYGLANAVAQARNGDQASAKQTIQNTRRTIRSLRRKGQDFGAISNRIVQKIKSMPSQANWASSKISSSYLELQFGWMQLLQDLYGIAEEAFSQRQYDDVVRYSYKVAEPVRHTSSVSWGYGVPGLRTENGICVGKVVYDFIRPRSGASQASTLGVSNPAYIVWDKLPLSFIFDWVYPIGSFLDALDGPLGLDFVRGCYVSYYKVEVASKVNRRRKVFGGFSEVHAQATSLRVYNERSVLEAFPHPVLPQPVSFTDIRHGPEKLLTLLAILRQKVRL